MFRSKTPACRERVGGGWPAQLLMPAMLLGATAFDAASQTVVMGTIRSAGRPVAGAEVRLEPEGITAAVDAAGGYRILAGHGGVVHLSVRAVGFYPAGRRMLLVANDTVRSDFALEPTPQQLDSVTVEGRGTSGRARMAAFEERRQAGIGRFYTREMLVLRENATMADVLRMTPGLRLIRRPDLCGGGFAVGTGRGGVARSEPWMKCGPGRVVSVEPACYFAIFLDGARFWVPGLREPPDINDFHAHGIQGIEVYRGPAETPTQYQGTNTACGVVMLWTRDGS